MKQILIKISESAAYLAVGIAFAAMVMLAGCATPCATRFDSAEKIANQPPECLKPAQVDLGMVGMSVIN